MFNALKNITANARRIAIAAALIGTAAMTGCSTTGTSSSNAPLAIAPSQSEHAAVVSVDEVRPHHIINRSKSHVTRTGEIYLMRGLANVFSRGIDKMTGDLRSKGYDASNFSYKFWEPVAADIVARAKRGEVSYPVVIMGHSLGGNESSKFANYLGARGVKVSLVVTFDPVETGHVGKNIERVINYYLPMDREDNRIFAKADFEGSIENINVTNDRSVTHTNVEKNARFQNASYRKIAELTRAM